MKKEIWVIRKKERRRWAIRTFETYFPGFNSEDEAQERINQDLELQKKGAVAVEMKDEVEWKVRRTKCQFADI